MLSFSDPLVYVAIVLFFLVVCALYLWGTKDN